MKLRIVSLFLLALCLAALPSTAQVLYSNGPTNGTGTGLTINFGFVVSDTFTLSANSTLTGFQFGAWLFPGDVLQTAEVQITSLEFGGTLYSAAHSIVTRCLALRRVAARAISMVTTSAPSRGRLERLWA